MTLAWLNYIKVEDSDVWRQLL